MLPADSRPPIEALAIDTSECPDCLTRSGLSLCGTCERTILPQLRRNVAWLKLMGEALVEQKKRQNRQVEYTHRAAIEKAKRRTARSQRRIAQMNALVAAA